MSLESYIEKQICYLASKNGWIAYKMYAAKEGGIPDRIFLKDGVAMFLEIKQPGKKPTQLQWAQIERLRQAGFVAEYVDEPKLAEQILRGLTRVSAPNDRTHPRTRLLCSVGGNGVGQNSSNTHSTSKSTE